MSLLEITIQCSTEFAQSLKQVDENARIVPVEGAAKFEFGLVEAASVATVVSGVVALADIIHRALTSKSMENGYSDKQADQDGATSNRAPKQVVIIIQGPISQVTLDFSGGESLQSVRTLIEECMEEF